METTFQLTQQIEQIQDVNERALLRCRAAKIFEDQGEYEAARTAMGDLWQRVGNKPNIFGLNSLIIAEVLLRSGTLTLWLGNAHQVAGAQEFARNLLTESLTYFENLNETLRVREVQVEIGCSYWAEGAYDEARVVLSETLNSLGDTNDNLKLIATLRLANVELSIGDFYKAYSIIKEVKSSVENTPSYNLKGKYYSSLALLQRKLAASENNPSLIDEALLNYSMASMYFEEGANRKAQALIENNLGYLLFKEERFADAEAHLKVARKIMVDLRDEHHVAFIDETCASLFLAEGRITQAELVARSAVNSLEKGGPQAHLAEALTTHAIALARLDKNAQAHLTFTRAVEVAERVGDTTGAGRAALSAFEELSCHLDRSTLLSYYQRADGFLRGDRPDVDMEMFQRLSRCAKYLQYLDKQKAVRETRSCGTTAYAASEKGVSYDFYPDVEIRSDMVPHTAVFSSSLFNVEDVTPFARLEGRVIHDRYGKYIAVLDEDLTTLRCPYTERVIAKKEEGRFVRPDGDIWALLERPVNISSVQ